MAGIKERIIKEVEKLPEDKIAEVYDFIHLFRIGIESQKKAVKDKRQEALKLFGIWKNMSSRESAVLDEIHSRRQRTFRERIL
ncbi:MAG: hypothetical protein HY035_02450 [Nitrospirae bacterium]|nr:hypothetical protein [Nitrospirota bacterium]MBI3377251.1 hypothetical protein [Nitrospirota bacterium]